MIVPRDQNLGLVPIERRYLHIADLTIKGFNPQEQTHWTRSAWADFGDGIVGVPRAWAFEQDFEIPTADGRPMDGPRHRPSFTGEYGYQESPVSDVVHGFQTYPDMILQAYTGSGKTVMGCEIAARLGRSTLILVDQERLMTQWVQTLKDFFGYDESEIGIVQGQKYDFENDFNIGMIQSVYDRWHEPEFYQAFGTVLYDEVHVAGAEQFSAVLEMFPARYRLGLSATPDRKDELKKLVSMHLECERVVLREDRALSRVYVAMYPFVGSWYANSSPKTGRFVSEIVDDGQRNMFLADIILWMYGKGRKVLVIGERVHHLECLASLVTWSGIPEEDVLLYTGKENYYKMERDPEPSKDPEHYVAGTEYSPVRYVLKSRKVNLKVRDDRLGSARIIFSTYAVFSKGVDVPDLDAGMEVTPKSSFIQEHGRILRRTTGKRIPIWVTIRDFNSSRAEYQFSKRILEFVKSNAETYIWPIPGESKLVRRAPAKLRREAEQRTDKLKDMKHVTGAGGSYTLQTKITAPGSYVSNVNRTIGGGK